MSLGSLDLHQGSSDNALEDGTSFIIEQMNFVNDEKLELFGNLVGFASDNIPLLWSGQDYVSFRKFTLRELHITCKLLDLYAKVPQLR